MTTAIYDEVGTEITDRVRKQPGFMLHAAYSTDDGMTVGEVWESQAQHDKWFDENVKPNVPAEIKVEVIQLHNVVRP